MEYISKIGKSKKMTSINWKLSCQRCPLRSSCKQAKLLFTLSSTHQNRLSVSLRANKNDELPSIPLKRLKSYFWNTVTCILYIVCHLPDFSDWCITVVLNDL